MPRVWRPVMCLASLNILSILMILKIWAMRLISDWPKASPSPAVPITKILYILFSAIAFKAFKYFFNRHALAFTQFKYFTWYSDEIQQKWHKIRKNSQQVNDVHGSFYKSETRNMMTGARSEDLWWWYLLYFLRGCHESDDILKRKPSNKDCFCHFKEVLFLWKIKRSLTHHWSC